MSTAIVLFRHDLRLADNPALHHACNTCDTVIPVFMWDPDALKPWAPGEASMYWKHQSLKSLDASLRQRKSRLIIAKGDAAKVIPKMAKDTGATLVTWNRRYEPKAIDADKKLKAKLQDAEVEVKSFNGALLSEPWEIQNKSGEHYRVFTPYWKACLREYEIAEPLEAPTISSPKTWPKSLDLDDLKLEPTIDWAGGIREAWDIGESGAHELLDAFLDETMVDYKSSRDAMAEIGTSRMSPYLANGEISPRQIWHAARIADESKSESYLRQLVWREFAYHILYHEPHTTDEPMRSEFAKFPWKKNAKALKRWQKGKTGYPVVDAGMRELWHTGYMHNRARMATASFLVKHLLIPWQEGEKWFWDTLVDADLANNSFGWQWTAGCGADAAPYFRIFNPIRQGERFDEKGEYVRRWIPELKEVPDKHVHSPWEADVKIDYPSPIVDHPEARDAALAAYEEVKG